MILHVWGEDAEMVELTKTLTSAGQHSIAFLAREYLINFKSVYKKYIFKCRFKFNLLFNSVEGYTLIEQLLLCGLIHFLLLYSRPHFLLIFFINRTYRLPWYEHEFGFNLLGIYSLLFLNI